MSQPVPFCFHLVNLSLHSYCYCVSVTELALKWLTIIQCGFPTDQRLTFLSSPPVTMTRPDLWPRPTQFTSAPWAANSSVTINYTFVTYQNEIKLYKLITDFPFNNAIYSDMFARRVQVWQQKNKCTARNYMPSGQNKRLSSINYHHIIYTVLTCTV